ncbi:MAG: imidazole glycerol-phosphate synthase subunit HisH [Actinomycetota bacterium]
MLDYGIGNLGSVYKALVHVGADAELVTDAADAKGADGVVLPGVGAFGACMNALRASGLDRAALDAVDDGTPLLAVCVGLQLLYQGSEESPGVDGLGVFAGDLVRLPAGVKHPQMQWNRVTPPAGRSGSSPLLDALGPEPWVYFVHSFVAPMSNDVVGVCDYGGEVVAAVERDRIWAAQFHPEKSSTAGLRLLRSFAESL